MNTEHHQQPWTPECTLQLLNLYLDGTSIPDIGKAMGRRAKAVESKIAGLRKRGDLSEFAKGKLPPPNNDKELYRNSDAVVQAELKMLAHLNTLGGMPVARQLAVPGTANSLTVWFGSDNKPHPIWLAKHMPEARVA